MAAFKSGGSGSQPYFWNPFVLRKIVSFKLAKPPPILLIISLLAFTEVRASGDPFPLGARAWGMANASVTLTDGWSLWNNTAGLAQVKDRQLLFAYDLRFGMAGLQTMAVGYVQPLRKGVAGVGVSRFGDELYSESTVGVAYGYQLDKISFGLKINYLQTAMAEIGSRRRITFELGCVAQLLPQLRLGAHIHNFSQTRFAADERIATVMKAGLSYLPIQKFMLNAEVEKDIDYPASFRIGAEYEIVRNLRLRTGIHTQPGVYCFGFGFSPKKLHLDYALRTHPVLGLSHQVSVVVRLTERKVSPQTSTD